jgi:hypothetical protein
MTGYRPDLEFFKAQYSSQPADQRPFHKSTYESDVPGIYLAGVVVAGMHTNEVFIENGRFHGRSLLEYCSRVNQFQRIRVICVYEGRISSASWNRAGTGITVFEFSVEFPGQEA